MAESISIFVVDDLRLLREELVSLLVEQEDFNVIGTAASGSKALQKIKELRPEIALIDIGMPGKDGLTVTQALRQELPQVKVIILGMPDLTDEIMACIEAGAAGYVPTEDGGQKTNDRSLPSPTSRSTMACFLPHSSNHRS